MADNNGAGAANSAPQINTLAQYMKDLSFENPNAPRSLAPQERGPNIAIQVNVNAQQLAESDFEVQLKLEGSAGEGADTLFKFELEYCGVFRLVNTLMIALIWPNTEKFNSSIRDGSMDYTILQPINSMFLVTFSRITVWRIWDLVLAIILIVVGINMAGDVITPLNILTFILLAITGMIIIYSLWIVLIAMTFWFTKFDNNVTILHALLDAGRYPATVYPVWLRVIVTFIIPVAVATTIPLQALRGDLGSGQILLFVLVSIISFWVASKVWKRGLKQYSGASS